ncbi:MAG: hypothetical protein KDD55_13595 [Bdellovibrionales bacterium]|nr:hypothetical protein [Bdellovibrionales bacterium]
MLRFFIFVSVLIFPLVFVGCSSTSQYLDAGRQARDGGQYRMALEQFELYLSKREADTALTAEFEELRRLYLDQQIDRAIALLRREEDKTVPRYVEALRILEETNKWGGSRDEHVRRAERELSAALQATQLQAREVTFALRGALRSEDVELARKYFLRAKKLDPASPLLSTLEPELARLAFLSLKPDLERFLRLPENGWFQAKALLTQYAENTHLSERWTEELYRMLQELRSGAVPEESLSGPIF